MSPPKHLTVEKYFQYKPSLALNVVALVLFFTVTVVIASQTVKYRQRFMWLVVFTGCLEIAGYISHLVATETVDLTAYIVNLVFIIMAPNFLALANYVCVGKVAEQLQLTGKATDAIFSVLWQTHHLQLPPLHAFIHICMLSLKSSEHISLHETALSACHKQISVLLGMLYTDFKRSYQFFLLTAGRFLNTKTIASLFFIIDIICIGVQGAGSAIISSTLQNSGKASTTGETIVLIGLAIQLFFFATFSVVTAYVYYLQRTRAANKVPFPIYACLLATILLITMRNAYRVVEIAVSSSMSTLSQCAQAFSPERSPYIPPCLAFLRHLPCVVLELNSHCISTYLHLL